MDRDERRKFWVWEIGFVVFFGVAIYGPWLSFLGFPVCFSIHLGFIVLYFLSLVSFGRDSNIEVGVVFSLLALMSALLAPKFEEARLNAQRHKHHQNALASSRPHIPTVRPPESGR